MIKKRARIALLAVSAAVLALFPACSTDPQEEAPAGFSINFVGMEPGAFGLESFDNKASDDPRMYLPENHMSVTGNNVTVTLYDTPFGEKPEARIAIRNADGKVTGLNYIGCDVGDMSGEMIAEDMKVELRRYISVPVSNAGQLSVLYKGNNTRTDIATDDDNHLQIAFVTEDGRILAYQSVPVMDTSVKENGVRMLSADITKAGTVRVVFSRNNTYKGGNPDKLTGSIDVFSITFIPAQ